MKFENTEKFDTHWNCFTPKTHDGHMKVASHSQLF
jgi:hypothetical protein